MWYIRLTDICLICSIVDDHCMLFVCVIYPFLQLILRDRCTGRVVRETQIDDIRCLLWKFWCESIFFLTWHVDHIAPKTGCCIIRSGSSCHNIRIYINRIYRIADSDLIVKGKDLLNISGITFCTVTDKYFVDCDVNTACIVIVLYDRTTQKLITKVRCIALKCLLHAHLGYCLMQTVYDGWCEWLGYITDTKTDDLLVRICLLIRTYFLANG